MSLGKGVSSATEFLKALTTSSNRHDFSMAKNGSCKVRPGIDTSVFKGHSTMQGSFYICSCSVQGSLIYYHGQSWLVKCHNLWKILQETHCPSKQSLWTAIAATQDRYSSFLCKPVLIITCCCVWIASSSLFTAFLYVHSVHHRLTSHIL